MTDYSLNEIASKGKLAAKGVGYSWGMAEEVVRVLLWLVQRELPGPKMLAQLLSLYSTPESIQKAIPSISENCFSTVSGWLCPLASGCALSDFYSTFQASEEIGMTNVKCPILLLPFVAELAAHNKITLTLELDSMRLSTDGEHVKFSSPHISELTHAHSVVCRVATACEGVFTNAERYNLLDRVKVDIRDLQQLDDYAHHTYAPATDASRALGAGAGLSDND